MRGRGAVFLAASVGALSDAPEGASRCEGDAASGDAVGSAASFPASGPAEQAHTRTSAERPPALKRNVIDFSSWAPFSPARSMGSTGTFRGARVCFVTQKNAAD